MSDMFVENAYDGYMGCNQDATRKDAFIAGYKVCLLDIKRVFSEHSIVNGIEYVNETIKKLKVATK